MGVWVVGVWFGWCLLVGVSGCCLVVVWWVALVVRVGGFAVGAVLCACRSGCVVWYQELAFSQLVLKELCTVALQRLLSRSTASTAAGLRRGQECA